jgi:hypothetical protein
MKRLGSIILILALAVAWPGQTPAAAQDQPVQIIFMHHSTGANLIAQGSVREGFTALGYEFWDHGYNGDGLVDPAGSWLGINWDMPDDNTDPDGWYNIFNQPVTDPPSNTLSHMLQADVIIFKSCFPTSNIDSEEMLRRYQGYYLSIRDVMDQYPDKLFIPFTPPPLVPNETTPENAARARQWADYLVSDEYLAGHPNIVVFNFFEQLADSDGFLRAEYRADEWDSHPNEVANAAVGPVFVDFVDQAIRDFVPGEAGAAPSAPITTEPGAEQPESPESDGSDAGVGEPGAIHDVFMGLESVGEWWAYTNEGVNGFACASDAEGYSGAGLHITFDIETGGSAGCGSDVVSGSAWAAADGITFYWRADKPGMPVRIGLGVKNPVQTSPDLVEATVFEKELLTPGQEWVMVTVRWDELIKPDWVGDTGVDTFDPAKVVWIVFDVGYWESAQSGAVWIDDVQLAH